MSNLVIIALAAIVIYCLPRWGAALCIATLYGVGVATLASVFFITVPEGTVRYLWFAEDMQTVWWFLGGFVFMFCMTIRNPAVGR